MEIKYRSLRDHVVFYISREDRIEGAPHLIRLDGISFPELNDLQLDTVARILTADLETNREAFEWVEVEA